MEEELQKAINEKDWLKAGQVVDKDYLEMKIQLARLTDPELKELTFLKTAIDTGDGVYLLQLVHVNGKKIKLQE